jgi:hypothetical protein
MNLAVAPFFLIFLFLTAALSVQFLLPKFCITSSRRKCSCTTTGAFSTMIDVSRSKLDMKFGLTCWQQQHDIDSHAIAKCMPWYVALLCCVQSDAMQHNSRAGAYKNFDCSAANSYSQKMYNWNTLNAKVCSRLNFVIPKAACDAAAKAEPMAIEGVLKFVRLRIAELEGGNRLFTASQQVCNTTYHPAMYCIGSVQDCLFLVRITIL